MKKTLVRLVVVLMFLGLVAFPVCGKDKQAGTAEKITITHYHWNAGPYNALLEKAVAAFEGAYPNVKVNILFLPDNERPVKIKTALAANGEIDSFGLTNAESPTYLYNKQAVEILPKAFGKKTIDEVVELWQPGAIKSLGGVWNKKYYGIPFELSNHVMFINTQFMKEAGLDPKTDIPKDWDQFVDVAKKMTKDEGGVRIRNGFSPGPGNASIYTIVNVMMQQIGLDWLSEKGALKSLDDPKARTVVETFTGFATKSKIWDPALFDNEKQGFGSGLCATMLTGGTWYWSVIDKYHLSRDNVAVAPYPRFKGGRDLGGLGYGYCLFVSRLSKNPEMAFRLLEAMASQPDEYLQKGLYQPKTALDQSVGRKFIPYFDVFAAELGKTTGSIETTHLAEIQKTLGAAVAAVIYEGKGIDEQLKKAKKEIAEIIED